VHWEDVGEGLEVRSYLLEVEFQREDFLFQGVIELEVDDVLVLDLSSVSEGEGN
jgi:hypothetical protein